ncbi:MAG: transposase, partial [Gammaproteobacteria bacterium]|nr:transposase [Gammaproteobacteria bacterium]
MQLYCGIDLHSNNNLISLIDDNDRLISEKRLDNDLDAIQLHLMPFRDDISGVVVESTYNWYWLVDGLMDKGYPVHLANTLAIQQYNGIKYTNDATDARFLAHLLRLKILPT